jgi:plastocyanin
MVTRDFTRDVVTLHRGDTLTLINDSNAVHVIGPGKNVHVASPQPGNPMTGFHLMQTNSVYTTGRWMTVGTFELTCTVHPGMNLKVVVVP